MLRARTWSACVSLPLTVALISSGCGAAALTARLDRARHAGECARVPEEVRRARGRAEPESSALPAGMPPEVRRVAEAARIDGAQLADRTLLLERMMLLETEIAAAASEIGCLDDQLETLQEELAERETRFELALTLASIGVGALAGVLGGVLDLTHPETPAAAITGIAGGVVSASLGVAALWPPRDTVELEHERNVLRALRAPATVPDGIVPRFVVRLLDAPRSRSTSPRAALVASWDDIFSSLDEPSREIVFGDGGHYDRSMLSLRELAIEELESELDFIRQDLELLLRYLYQTAPASE